MYLSMIFFLLLQSLPYNLYVKLIVNLFVTLWRSDLRSAKSNFTHTIITLISFNQLNTFEQLFLIKSYNYLNWFKIAD